MLKVVIVGTGWWGMELGKTAHALPDVVELGGCCSLSAEERARFTGRFGGGEYADYADVLADDSVDAVFLATPHSLHWQQIVAAAEAGKHVFCEKPLALTVETAAAAIAACDKAGVVLAVGHNRRFSPVARRMKELVDSGSCGEIVHAEGNYSSPGALTYPPDYWRAQRDELPGGGLTPMALHVVDTMSWILGPVKRLAAIAQRRVVDVAIDDTLGALMELESGITFSLGSVFVVPLSSYLRLYGTKANLEARDNFSELRVTRLDANEPAEVLTFSTDDTLEQEFRAFAAAAAGEAPYPLAPAEALRNVAVVEAVRDSSENGGAWVTLKQGA